MTDKEPNTSIENFKIWKQENRSLTTNPFMHQLAIPTRWTKGEPTTTDVHKSQLTGEAVGVHEFRKTKQVDEQHFVKIFKECLADIYNLNKTSAQVFSIVLAEYEKTPLKSGYADTVELFIKANTLNGEPMKISTRTWTRGLKELVEKRFIWPRGNDTYWINPAMFFKGDRIRAVKEYNLIGRPNNAAINGAITELPNNEDEN